jgi:sensor histidine kinase regulating citrate/malate metabolism
MRWWQLKKRDADLERELRSDLELEEEQQRERGMSLDEARYTARRAFGNRTLIKEQTHEAWGWAPFGIRMALGAERSWIAWMILRETLLLVVCGLAIGVPVAVFVSRMIASQLFGLKSGDPVTFLVASAVTIMASLLPARRAASVNPMQALRSE